MLIKQTNMRDATKLYTLFFFYIHLNIRSQQLT